MHELSVAQSITDFALSEANKHKAERVKELCVDVGELMQVDTTVLRDALKMLTTNLKFKDCDVRIDVVRAAFACRRCSSRWGMAEAKRQLGAVPKDLLVKNLTATNCRCTSSPTFIPRSSTVRSAEAPMSW